MIIIPLEADCYTLDEQKHFTPVQSENTSPSPGKTVKLAVRPFLIITSTDFILLDTGLGLMKDGKPLIPFLLEKQGIKAEQITKILISHLHKDHICGIGHFSGHTFKANFPNADIFIQLKEWGYALSQVNNSSYDARLLRQLGTLRHIKIQDEDQGDINAQISFEIVGGHTPFHQVFWIREGEETVFYGADNLPQRGYLKYHIAYKNDYDGVKAKHLRQQWEAEAKKEKWKVLLYHDIDQAEIQF